MIYVCLVFIPTEDDIQMLREIMSSLKDEGGGGDVPQMEIAPDETNITPASPGLLSYFQDGGVSFTPPLPPVYVFICMNSLIATNYHLAKLLAQ